MVAIAVSGHWTRLRTLGRGASGAVVSLAADDASGQLVAVKSAPAADAALLRREQGILSGLCSPNIVPCFGGATEDGSYHLFLEFAPGGSLADEVARRGGRLEERAVRAYAADVLRGLAYLHARSVVHGDVKARNVVIGADGRAKLADFGCARGVMDTARPIGGTPAFMAPEVARGEEQGPAADVWALGCTVVEMATGRAPWSDMSDLFAAVHRIGYTDAVPDVPAWLSAEAKDFLALCFARNAGDRCSAAQLLEHPFVAFAGKAPQAKWVSPKSTLDAASWESETEDEEEEDQVSSAERIKSLSCSISALPEWDFEEEGWIDVLGDSSATMESADVAGEPAEDSAVVGGLLSDELEAEDEKEAFGGEVVAADPSIESHYEVVCLCSDSDVHSLRLLCNDEIAAMKILNFHKYCSPIITVRFFLVDRFLLYAGLILNILTSVSNHAVRSTVKMACL